VVSACREGQWTCGLPDTYQSPEGACDGLDNDCNGRVDDIAGRGEACEAGVGACARPGVLACVVGQDGMVCTAEPAPPLAERCNDIDDDCNGLVDDVPEAGTPCRAGDGECAVAGETLCRQGRLQCSAQPAPPRAEICDGRDNDCDGRLDEEVPPPCNPRDEACNGLDDDQDGRVDEALSRPCQGVCGGGREHCEAGAWSACDARQPAAERCNAEDDDCDGRADEGLERPCETACGLGIERCAVGEWLACNAPQPRLEACDQVDDDCDGQVDEGACGRCHGQGDGVVIEAAMWGACEGFADACDETGLRTREVRVCRRQVEVIEPEVEPCQRGTDGQRVGAEPWGACGGFVGACGTSGRENRAVQICAGGRAVADQEERPCARDTEGLVITPGEWGACEGFADACAEDGARRRRREVCRAERPVFEDLEEPCRRATEGQVIDPAELGECIGFIDDCDETGIQRGRASVCRGGAVVVEDVEAVCQRETDGRELRPGDWGACGHFTDPCDESGTRSRNAEICRDGRLAVEPVEEACERETDGLELDPGVLGPCGGFDGVCDEIGLQRRNATICRAGRAVGEAVEAVCQRDTDGIVVNQGGFGVCDGFSDVCDETGMQTRDIQYCLNGGLDLRREQQACQRDTDGLILDPGNFGACGGFSDACDESGIQQRLIRFCQNGFENNRQEQQACQRDTDGFIVDSGNFGACGGFADACDESGTQQRTVRFCQNGFENNRGEQQACQRDTDGTITNVGNFGACGGFSDACDESGTQQRTVRFCQNGFESNRQEQQGCQRNTDGVGCPGGGHCENGRCLVEEVCNGVDDDGDGVVDNPDTPIRGCMWWITHHTNCQFRSWHGAWQTATVAEERAAASCPPNPASPQAGCGACQVANHACGVPPYAASYQTCWVNADGNRLRTYVQQQPAQGFTLLLRHCYNNATGQNTYITGATCAAIAGGWVDGTPAAMGYMAANQPNGVWEENVLRYYVCRHRNADGFENHWITRDCAAGDRVRTLGWSFGP